MYDWITKDIKSKIDSDTIGVIFPILSRNRFAICLKGIAAAAKKIVLMLSYPSDEVGNALLTYDQLDEAGVNPYSDVLSLEKYRELFGYKKHEFTGVDYVEYYSNIIKEAGAEVSVLRAMGGSANSLLWTQIKSDVTGKPIVVPSSDTATTLGAAILAGVGIGMYKDFEEAVELTVENKRFHEPNPENYEVYNKNYEIYLELYNQLKETMKK